MIAFRPSVKFDKQALIILFTKEQIKSKKFIIKNKIINEATTDLIFSGQFSGDDGQIFPLVVNKKLVLAVGIGASKDLSLTALRITVRKALLSSYLNEIKDVEIGLSNENFDEVIAVIEGALIGTYAWKKYLTKDKKNKTVDQKNIFIVTDKKKSYEDAVAICEGNNLTRDLINENADVADSVYIEKIIKGLIKGKKNIDIEVLNEKQMKAKGLGLHLAVNQGSNKEPKLIIVKYTGASKKDPYVALVGKGVTYDTGGLNLKPSGSIEGMKQDMSGTAAVVGTLKNTLSLKPKKNIIFACALAENAIGSGAYKPGDIFKGYAGKTVEIANTDAEGRLVLADAISYIIKNYKPAQLIDIATLTGACIVALGNDYTGLVSTDDKLANQLLEAAQKTDDRAWRLPSYPELKSSVKSKIADIRNLGFSKGAGGTITAAEFLRQFAEVDGTKWAHLDIAGTAFVDGAERMYFAHGATGAGVRLLTQFLKEK
ncbi:Cytosol aminopeptidase PepA [hydrothermal vent metagenome]|uniref:leucyl aminopeptidase n=1 Tax=hydrothermal vent metagenome TaxID=652676 RepID=A0A3B1DSZ9_9ZZZZ